MKKPLIIFYLILFFISCSNGQKEQINGEWKLESCTYGNSHINLYDVDPLEKKKFIKAAQWSQMLFRKSDTVKFDKQFDKMFSKRKSIYINISKSRGCVSNLNETICNNAREFDYYLKGKHLVVSPKKSKSHDQIEDEKNTRTSNHLYQKELNTITELYKTERFRLSIKNDKLILTAIINENKFSDNTKYSYIFKKKSP